MAGKNPTSQQPVDNSLNNSVQSKKRAVAMEATSPPIMPQDDSFTAVIKNEFNNPKLFWRNMNALFHSAVFGLAIFVFRRYGWWLKTQ